jgi:CRP-like cAMP-binding protein
VGIRTIKKREQGVSEQAANISAHTTINADITKFLFSYGRKTIINSGQIFITEGQMSRSVFVLLEGEAEILKRDDDGQENIVARVGSGTILGEMGVFMQAERTTSVRAASNIIALEFTADSFFTAIAKIPELGVRIIKSLSQKLKASNDFTLGIRKAHNLLAVGNNILVQMEGAGPFKFELNLTELSKVTAIGRNAIMAEMDRLHAAGVVGQLKRSGVMVNGVAEGKKLSEFLNQSTFPRPGKGE